MNKIIYKSIFSYLLVLIIGSLSLYSFGQNPKECISKTLQKPDFKVAFMSAGEIFVLRLIVKSEYRTDENLILVAKYLNRKYCEEDRINALIFDNKEDAREFSVYEIKQIPNTLRAIYFLDRKKGEENLSRTRVINNKIEETQINLQEDFEKNPNEGDVKNLQKP